MDVPRVLDAPQGADSPEECPRSFTLSRVWALLPGALLIVYAVGLHALAARLAREPAAEERVRAELALTSMVAGGLYLGAMARAARSRWSVAPGRSFLVWSVICALLARAIVAAAPPLLENDFYRYLWDGAVTAEGIIPYSVAPGAVLAGEDLGPDHVRFRALALEAGNVLPAINHPELTTIYPPLAQAAFAFAYWLEPFSLRAWRGVLLLCEVLTVWLLLRWLTALSLPTGALAWYTANPLLLREAYSALHMDVLVLPFAAGVGLLVALQRRKLAAVACVLGALVKVWPVLLLAHTLRGCVQMRAVRSATLLLGAVALLLFLVRDWTAGVATTNGVLAYGQSWQNNDGFFRAGVWMTERVLGWLSIAPWHSHALMRAVSAGLLLVFLLWRARATHSYGTAGELLAISGGAFLLSPTQFPWYWLWLLPFLVVRPFLPLLLYVALLPLYHLQSHGTWVYWAEHLPVWCFLALAAVAAWRARGVSSPASGALHA